MKRYLKNKIKRWLKETTFGTKDFKSFEKWLTLSTKKNTSQKLELLANPTLKKSFEGILKDIFLARERKRIMNEIYIQLSALFVKEKESHVGSQKIDVVLKSIDNSLDYYKTKQDTWFIQ